MNNPTVGALNKRVRFDFRKSVPNKDAGFSNQTVESFEVWGRVEDVGYQVFWDSSQIDQVVTHRIFVRRITGKTRPQDLTKLVLVSCEGLRYRVRRSMDIGGQERFTVIEAQLEGVK